MTRHCGELQEISGTSGGGYSANGRSSTTAEGNHILRSIGAVFGIMAELPLLIVGKKKFRGIRLCQPELEGFLREGETVCIYVFRHLLHKLVVIGVRSGDGPSWTMSYARLLATVSGYLLVWPLIAGIPFGEHRATLGIALGLLFSTGISWLSAFRLVTAWRAMQHG